MKCTLCPRLCGAEREKGELGVCGQSNVMRIARAALHPYEEPPISGINGSGTIFFCGCSLRCVFCQNRTISRSAEVGTPISPQELAKCMLSLQEKGAHNINLVTPTHFADGIRRALASVRSRLTVPVVWNSSGYESVSTLRSLEGLVDIYLPDFKYFSAELAQNYSAAPNYRPVAEAALTEMFRQTGRVRYNAEGLLQKGLMVRHLVLPGGRRDSMALLERLADLLPVDDILLSLMSQYTPDFAMDSPYSVLHRRLTTFEYESVRQRAADLGFHGFMQQRTSAAASYTPDFPTDDLNR